MNTNFLTIIIPTKNRIELLQKCLGALSNQKAYLRHFEILVIDDHSSPRTKNSYNLIINAYQNLSVRVFFLDKTRGAVHARNYGLSKCTCSVVGFLDDDSIPDENWVSTIEKVFTASPGIGAISGHIDAFELNHPLSAFRQNFYDLRFKELQTPSKSKSIAKAYNVCGRSDYFLTDNISGGNSAIRKQLLDELNGFDIEFISMHDKELTLRLLKKGIATVFCPALKIKHFHTKSLNDALNKSFRSGQMSFKLRQKHRELDCIAPFSLDLRNPLIIVNKARPTVKRSNLRLFSLNILIFILDYTHQIGYLMEFAKVKLHLKSKQPVT